MLVFSGYGYDGGKILYKGETYTVSMYFQGSEPGKAKVESIFRNTLAPFFEFVSISSSTHAEIPQYNIVLKLKVRETTAKKVIELINMQFSKYKPEVTDISGGSVKLKELPTAMQVATSIEIPKTILKETARGAYSIAESGVSKIGSYLPSLATLKWIGIAAGVGVVLFYVGPLLRAGGTMASRIVERIPEKNK